MKQQKSLIRISELLSRFKIQTNILNSNSQLDINIIAEDILIPILNIAYNCNLSNAKYTEKDNTFPALDLLDKTNRIAFQITSTPKIKKVRETIEKIISHNFQTKFDIFYIYIITQKQDSYDKTILETATKNLFKFDENNVIDERDLYQKIASLSLNDIIKIEHLLENQFSDIQRDENKIQTDLNTIIQMPKENEEQKLLNFELKGQYDIRKILVEKKIFFEKRIITISDASMEFELITRIGEINSKINECNNNISSILNKIKN